MKLLEKLKNTFFEEEYVEVEEPRKEEMVAKKVEIKEAKEEIPVSKIEVQEIEEIEEPVVKEERIETYSDRDLVKKNSKINYFEDEDFEPVKPVITPKEKKEPKKIYGGAGDKLYESIKIDNITTRPYGNTGKGRFQPTPIISPIYGILDKNYNKDEIIDKKDKPSSYVSRKNADLDSIRRKAYGTIEEELPFGNYVEEKADEKENDEPLLYNMMVDDTKPVVSDVTISDAEEYFNDLGLEYNIDYKDGKYENAVGRRTSIHEDEENGIDEVIINNNNLKNESKVTTDNIKEEDDDLPLEDNLFDLVDSMYDESGDE